MALALNQRHYFALKLDSMSMKPPCIFIHVSIAYWGDKLEMQNKFGAWVPFTYWCRYNPTTKRSKVTHLAPGR